MREIEYSNKEFGNKLAKNVIRELGLKCEPAEIQSNIHSWGYFIGNESGLSIVWGLSIITELECLVLPLRLKRTDIADKFNRFFAINLRLEMPDPIYRHATNLRADFGLKTPDALHLATALHHGCTDFWTNDERLSGVAENLSINVGAFD